MAYYIQKLQGPNKGKFIHFHWDKSNNKKWIEDVNKAWNFDFVVNAETFIRNFGLKNCIVIKVTSI